VPTAEALGYIVIFLQWQRAYILSQHLTAYRVSKVTKFSDNRKYKTFIMFGEAAQQTCQSL